MGGGGEVAAPQPSEAEQNLQQQQADLLQQQTTILQQQYAQQQLLAPILYKQAGLTPTYAADGTTITGFTQTADPNADLTSSIQTQLLQREQDALNGKLPIDPALTNELNSEDTTLNSSLQKNLGPGYATSTPGIQSLAAQANKRGELTYAASTGDLTTAAALQTGQASSTADLQNASLNRILGIQSGGNQFASLYGNAAASTGGAISGYQNQDQLSLNAAVQNQNAKAAAAGQQQAAIGAGVGIAAAAAIAI